MVVSWKEECIGIQTWRQTYLDVTLNIVCCVQGE
jgi:hypothetical protein